MALKDCAECGGKVSTGAERCPGCGASVPNRMSGYAALAGVLLFVGAVAWAGMHGESKAAGDTELVASLRAKQPLCQQNYRKALALGLMHEDYSRPGVTAIVWPEGAWAMLEHDDKVKQAVLAYCAKMPADGHYMVLIKGLHDGKTMASVTDGNYFD